MSILGESSSGDGSPERRIEKEEQTIVKQLKQVDNQLKQILNDEERLLGALEDQKRKDIIDQHLKDIEIALEEDIEGEESTLEGEIRKLRGEEEKMAKEGNLTDDHKALLDLLGQIINELSDEQRRLEDLAQKGREVVRGRNIDYSKALNELRKHTKADEEEVLDLQNRIHEAAKLERKIMDNH